MQIKQPQNNPLIFLSQRISQFHSPLEKKIPEIFSVGVTTSLRRDANAALSPDLQNCILFLLQIVPLRMAIQQLLSTQRISLYVDDPVTKTEKQRASGQSKRDPL